MMYRCVFVRERVRSISDAAKLRVQGWTVRLLQWLARSVCSKSKRKQHSTIAEGHWGLKTSLKVHKYYCMETHTHRDGDKQPAKAGLIEMWPPVDVSGYLFITMRRTDSREFVSPFQTRLLLLPWLSTFRFSLGVLLPGDLVTEEFHRALTWRKSRREEEEKCVNSMSYHWTQQWVLKKIWNFLMIKPTAGVKEDL